MQKSEGIYFDIRIATDKIMLTPSSQPASETNSEFFHHLYDSYGGALYKVIIDFTTTTEEAEAVFTESFRQICLKYPCRNEFAPVTFKNLLQVTLQVLLKLNAGSVSREQLVNYFQKKMIVSPGAEAA